MRSKGSISDYAGHFYVARIDPISHTQVWRKEMERFGYSASLVYKDWGVADSGNLLVGGALDYSRWTGNESNINWRLAIMRITEDGGSPASGDTITYLDQEITNADMSRYAPFIDHMHLDD